MAPAQPIATGPATTRSAETNSHWLRDTRTDCWVYYPFDPAGITNVSWSGSCDDHEASGQGSLKISRPEGAEMFAGTFARGRLEGDGDVLAADGLRIRGEFHGGVGNGKVEMIWPSGTHYEGEMVNHNIHGEGQFSWSNGDGYKGSFQRGLLWGHGVLTLAGGEAIEGKFVAGAPSGFVRVQLANGNVLRGDFKPPQPDPARPADPPVFPAAGLQTDREVGVSLRYHVQADGSIKDVQIEGSSGIPDIDGAARSAIQAWHMLPATVNGVPIPYALADDYVLKVGTRNWETDGHYEGQFVNRKFDGQGKVTWPGGDTYAGGFRQGFENGQGIYRCTDGWVYEGNFRSGVLSGHAVIRKPDGTRLEGEVVPPHYDPKNPPPEIRYPPDAVRSNQEGTAVVRFRVGADGTVRDAHVIFGTNTPALDDEAIAEVFRSRLIPGTLNGNPVELEAVREIRFVLE